ncbi:MAG: RNA-dependent RNA polymerase [Sanya nephotettix cincticeps totivirus 1]|nr:MAG: RNA-dependent RNA polymerase [Sanya nephotettix cincticeps totivirus 1]
MQLLGDKLRPLEKCWLEKGGMYFADVNLETRCDCGLTGPDLSVMPSAYMRCWVSSLDIRFSGPQVPELALEVEGAPGYNRGAALLRTISVLREYLPSCNMADPPVLDALFTKFHPMYQDSDSPTLKTSMLTDVHNACGNVTRVGEGTVHGVATLALLTSLGRPDLKHARSAFPALPGTRQHAAFAWADVVALAALATPKPQTVLDDNTGTYQLRGLRNDVASWLDDVVSSVNSGGSSTDRFTPPPPPVLNWFVRRLPSLATPDGGVDWEQVSNLSTEALVSTRRLYPGLVLKRSQHTGSSFIAWSVFVRSSKHRKHLKALNGLFPPSSQTDSRHQTAHVADLVWHIIHNPGSGRSPAHNMRAVNGVLRHIPIGTNQVLVSALLVAALGASWKDVLCSELLHSGMVWRPSHLQQSTLKAYSNLVRRCRVGLSMQSLHEAQVAQLAYYDLCFGRSNNVTDWESEFSNRCKATIHIQSPSARIEVSAGTRSLSFGWLDDASNLSVADHKRDATFYRNLRRELMDICDPLVTRRNTSEPLATFIQRRHEWMASGSSAGAVQAVRVHRGRQGKGALFTGEVKVSKRAWGESLTLEAVQATLLEDHPHELATASEKYENGKSRAIYGVEPMHYVINTYATKGFEERLHLIPGLEKGASGAAAAAFEQARANITADPGVECSMLDYADFNRHHTPAAQAIIFEVFAALGRRRGANSDWIEANLWVAKAKRSMRVRFPHLPGEHKVLQGMFSGTRSTDLINTLLNLAYFRVAKNWVSDHLGLEPSCLYHVHQGDDVWVSNRDATWARALFYALNSMGFLFQPTKQMFGKQRGEYLRVLYSHGQGYGYLGRALANYVLRPIQNANPLSPVSWATSIYDSVCLLQRRGISASMARAIYDDAVGFWVRARAHDLDRAPVSVPREYVQLARAQGGLGCPPPDVLLPPPSTECLTLPPPPAVKSSFKAKQLGVPTKMTDDWIAYISAKHAASSLVQQGGRELRVDLLRDEMIQSNYATDLATVLPERGWADHKRDWAKARTNVPKWATLQLRQGGPVPGTPAGVVQAQIRALYQSRVLEGVTPPYPVLELDSKIITAGHVIKGTKLGTLSDVLIGIITKSTFKSEKTTAKALGITRAEAILQILADADDHGSAELDAMSLLYPLLNANNVEALEVVLGEGGELVPHLSAYVNPTYWQYMQRVLIDMLCIELRSRPHLTQPQLLYGDGRGWAAWAATLTSDNGPLCRVVY